MFADCHSLDPAPCLFRVLAAVSLQRAFPASKAPCAAHRFALQTRVFSEPAPSSTG